MDREKQCIKRRSWLSAITRQQPQSQSSLGASMETKDFACEPSIPSYSLLQNTPPQLPPRSRTVSWASDDSGSAATVFESSSNTFAAATSREAVRRYNIIDHSKTDMAIAMTLRARQEDRLGNHEDAARLFVASLEHMSASLQDASDIRDVNVRERLATLKLLLESADTLPVNQHAHALQKTDIIDAGKVQLPKMSYDNNEAAAPLCYIALGRATSGVRSTLLLTAERLFEMLNQAIIIWLVFLGNLFVWTAVQFKNSDLPEMTAKYSIMAGVWVYNTCREWNAHIYAVRAGQIIIGWLSSIDKETGLSQKVLCSMAAILGAVARVAEESTMTARPGSSGHVRSSN
ncbi:hypothetical protein GGI25_002568 [Coemansia spiralis]|uniref:Uncharacterized protein n=2 Tax=Coemansia TaxID=4863 RepID=A0A9W8G9Y6_9FUNG|nr:hypothetical protein GGI25_002568 [Coemansia spiralis]